MSGLREKLEQAARAYGSACANHQHDRNKPGGSRDRRAFRWKAFEKALALMESEQGEPERIAELEWSITAFILEMDKLMVGPSTHERGRRIAGLLGGLQSILGAESIGEQMVTNG